MNRTVSLLILCLSAFFAGARVVTPSDLRYLDSEGKLMTVVDPDGYLSPRVRNNVENQLTELRRKYSVEVEVVLPSEIGDVEPQQWCEQLFSDWKIGKEDKDNGLLIMISPGSRAAFIMPGYGMEGIFTDIACAKLVRNVIIPAMRENNVDAAVSGVVSDIVKTIENPEAAAELRSDRKENLNGAVESLDPEVIWTFIQYVIAFLFLATFLIFLYYGRKAKAFTTHYEKAEFWRSKLPLLGLFGLLSFGTGLIFFVLAFIIYRSWRTRPLPCSTCGHKMKRLPEDKDNELLSDSQDFEERIKTVDYDVWECPRCGTIERFPFKSSQKKYTECPSCHTIAMCLESDSIVRPSSVKYAGEGVRIYGCKFCHNRLRRPYVIPKKEDPTAAIGAAAAIIGSSSRGPGGGFGGGGFGGFGGGATGGGGAGGRW